MTRYTAISPLTGTTHEVTTKRSVAAFAFVAMTDDAGEVRECVYTSATLAGADKIARREFTYRTKPRPSGSQMPADRVRYATAAATGEGR